MACRGVPFTSSNILSSVSATMQVSRRCAATLMCRAYAEYCLRNTGCCRTTPCLTSEISLSGGT